MRRVWWWLPAALLTGVMAFGLLLGAGRRLAAQTDEQPLAVALTCALDHEDVSPPGATVTVTLTQPDGAPVAGRLIRLEIDSGRFVPRNPAPTGPDGVVRFPLIIPFDLAIDAEETATARFSGDGQFMASECRLGYRVRGEGLPAPGAAPGGNGENRADGRSAGAGGEPNPGMPEEAVATPQVAPDSATPQSMPVVATPAITAGRPVAAPVVGGDAVAALAGQRVQVCATFDSRFLRATYSQIARLEVISAERGVVIRGRAPMVIVVVRVTNLTELRAGSLFYNSEPAFYLLDDQGRKWEPFRAGGSLLEFYASYSALPANASFSASSATDRRVLLFENVPQVRGLLLMDDPDVCFPLLPRDLNPN